MEEVAERIAELIKKQIDGRLNEEERKELASWEAQSDENQTKLSELTNRDIVTDKLEQFEQFDEERSWAQLKKQCLHEEVPIIPIKRRRRWMWAAAAVIVFGVVGYFLWVPRYARNDKADIATQDQRFKNDVSPPATNKATLTLEDGTVIVLDSAGNGEIAGQDGARVMKMNNELSYEKVPRSYAPRDDKVKYNTLNVPKGSKPVQLVLADGSKVWLDAATSITYPTVFVGEERKVVMNGQAYFEASPIPSKGGGKTKFIVQSGDVEVQVLGTHFNVKAFDDEDFKVTLLEGSVKVLRFASRNERDRHDDKAVVIKPGQQAEVPRRSAPRDDKGAIVVSSNINLDEVMAWKNGMFNFRGAKIEAIMKEVARWYDVEVVYEGKPKDEFVAPISRDVPVSKLLKLLEMTEKVKFRIEGRKVVVMR